MLYSFYQGLFRESIAQYYISAFTWWLCWRCLKIKPAGLWALSVHQDILEWLSPHLLRVSYHIICLGGSHSCSLFRCLPSNWSWFIISMMNGKPRKGLLTISVLCFMYWSLYFWSMDFPMLFQMDLFIWSYSRYCWFHSYFMNTVGSIRSTICIFWRIWSMQ